VIEAKYAQGAAIMMMAVLQRIGLLGVHRGLAVEDRVGGGIVAIVPAS
jgi:hypothetical protein